MIKQIEPYLMLVWFVASLIVQMVYFLKDDRTENHTKIDLFLKMIWHAAAGSIHIWGGVMMSLHYGVGIGVLTSALTWFLIDGAINSWVLNREWFYIGTTAMLDKVQRSLAKWLRIDDHRAVSAILKFIFLAGAILNLFVS